MPIELRAGVRLRQLKDSCHWTWLIYRVISQILFQVAPTNAYRSVCNIVRVRFVELSINQWHHRGSSSESLSFGRRATRVVFILFLNECYRFLFFSVISKWTDLCAKGSEEIARLLVMMMRPLSSLRKRVAESWIYIWLNDCRQWRERAFVRGCAAIDDTIYASRDRSRTTQGSHQWWSHLRIPW